MKAIFLQYGQEKDLASDYNQYSVILYIQSIWQPQHPLLGRAKKAPFLEFTSKLSLGDGSTIQLEECSDDGKTCTESYFGRQMTQTHTYN